MNNKTKLLIALTGILAVVIIALVINDKNAQQKRAAQSSQNQNVSAETAFKPIPAYESLDEIVAGINSDVNLDTTVASENDASASYVGQFDSSINISNLYNASDF